LKKPFTKKGWWNGSRCRLSSNPSTAKKRKRKKEQIINLKVNISTETSESKKMLSNAFDNLKDMNKCPGLSPQH
jgi:hypothetical protein